jgi:hypothetical protein
MGPDDSDMITASLLQAARAIYESYRKTHVEPQLPLGVAINRQTQRGHLIFTGKPVLLPQECFIPLTQLETPEEE